jgi:endonuclease IV
MARTVSFALGNIWRWSRARNRNNLLAHIRKLEVDGVELTFSSKEELYNFKLSKKNEKWLRSLSYVTIHSPFNMIKRADNEEEVIRQLVFIDRLYKKIKAKNVVIHPEDLPSPKILNKFDFNVSTENLLKKRNVTIAKLRKIMKKYPRIGFCLDVSHAYIWSKYETQKLVRAFGKRITQIHFSGTYKKKDHQSLRAVSRDFMFSIRPVFRLNAPIVIEEDIRVKSARFLREEVDFIRSMFVK